MGKARAGGAGPEGRAWLRPRLAPPAAGRAGRAPHPPPSRLGCGAGSGGSLRGPGGEGKGGGPGRRRGEARPAARGGTARARCPSALLPPCARRGPPRGLGGRGALAHASAPPRPPSPGRVGGGSLSRQIQGRRYMATRRRLPLLGRAEARWRAARSRPRVTWGARSLLYLCRPSPPGPARQTPSNLKRQLIVLG